MDHEAKTFRKISFAKGGEELEKAIIVNGAEIEQKMKRPVTRTTIDNEKMVTKRATKGLINVKDRTDEVSGYICRVYLVSGIKVNSKSRSEHLEFESVEELNQHRNPNNITDIEYFSAADENELKEKDVGLVRKMKDSNSEFKAYLWMSEEFPFSVKEQLIPVLQLMSLINSHFQKLSNFISINLPKGFPVQIGKYFAHHFCMR